MSELKIEKENGNFANSLLSAGWIPVAERIPPPVTAVLVFGWCCPAWHYIRIAEWEDGVGWWQSFSGEILTFVPEYWMPLPFPCNDIF